MTQIKKAKEISPTSSKELPATAGKDNDLLEYHFLISESAPDLLPIFSRLKAIAITRKNEQVKHEILQCLKVLFVAVGQRTQQIKSLYREIKRLEKSNQIKREVITQMTNESGIDPGFILDQLRLDAIVEDQLERVERMLRKYDNENQNLLR